LQPVIDILPANTISHHFISSTKHYLACERSAKELACGTRARKLSSRPASKHCKSPTILLTPSKNKRACTSHDHNLRNLSEWHNKSSMTSQPSVGDTRPPTSAALRYFILHVFGQVTQCVNDKECTPASYARGPQKHYTYGKIIPYNSHALQLKGKLEKFASQQSQLDASFCKILEQRYLVKREFERQVEKPQCIHQMEGNKSVGFEAKCEYRSAVRNILEDCRAEIKRIRKEAAEGLQLLSDEGTNEAGGNACIWRHTFRNAVPRLPHGQISKGASSKTGHSMF